MEVAKTEALRTGASEEIELAGDVRWQRDSEQKRLRAGTPRGGYGAECAALGETREHTRRDGGGSGDAHGGDGADDVGRTADNARRGLRRGGEERLREENIRNVEERLGVAARTHRGGGHRTHGPPTRVDAREVAHPAALRARGGRTAGDRGELGGRTGVEQPDDETEREAGERGSAPLAAERRSARGRGAGGAERGRGERDTVVSEAEQRSG